MWEILWYGCSCYFMVGYRFDKLRAAFPAMRLWGFQASIVGKRMGKHLWFRTGSTKTIEGSAAFALSVILCAESLRVIGALESFQVSCLEWDAVASKMELLAPSRADVYSLLTRCCSCALIFWFL